MKNNHRTPPQQNEFRPQTSHPQTLHPINRPIQRSGIIVIRPATLQRAPRYDSPARTSSARESQLFAIYPIPYTTPRNTYVGVRGQKEAAKMRMRNEGGEQRATHQPLRASACVFGSATFEISRCMCVCVCVYREKKKERRPR